MIVLIIGYGSAGNRHAKILNSLKKIKKIFIKTNQNINSFKKFVFIRDIKNLDPDLIVIANDYFFSKLMFAIQVWGIFCQLPFPGKYRFL